MTTPYSVITSDDGAAPLPGMTYTNQDYHSLKSRMLEIVKQKFGKDFTDFSESSLAIMLIELWAFLADQLSFKIDQVHNEHYVDSVTELANMLRMADFVGFKPTPPTPAKAMFSININHAMTNDFAIDVPLAISFQAANGMGEKHMELFHADERGEPVYDQQIIVPAGSTFINNVVGIEGRTNFRQVEANWEPWQQITLGTTSVLWGSVVVLVDGVRWREVEFFSGWKPLAEYRVEYIAEQYQGVVIFGDNATGLIPPKGANIRIAYRVGGGEGGNIVTGAINRSVPIHVAGLQQMVTCQVSNYTKGEGGYSGDGLEEIRAKLPLYMKTQNRAVTGADYKAICENFASPTNGTVGKAALALRNQGCAGNVVDIYILARDGPLGLTKAGDNLKKELSAELLQKKMFSDYVCIRDGEIVYADIVINMVLKSTDKRAESTVNEKVRRRIATLFSLSNFDFGQSLKESDVVKVLADVKEIDRLSASFTTVQSIEAGYGAVPVVSTAFNEIIRPDNITLNFQYE